MIAVILAAGYATRMYPLTENFPKPLLKIDEATILDRLMADLEKIDVISEYVIVSNHKFISHFKEWKGKSAYKKPISLVDDGSTENENRLGAVKDLLLAIQEKSLWNKDLLVMAADNLIDFSLAGFIQFFEEKQTSLIMCHHEPEISKLQKTGVITMVESNKVLEMEEKPQVPKSNWAVPPFYIYKKEDIPNILTSIEGGCTTDAPGNLAKVMLSKTIFHAWEMPGKRIDIGSLDSYHTHSNTK